MSENVPTKFSAEETVYAAIADLEWDDLWDAYERALKMLAMAHEGPREKYGLPDTDPGDLLQELRILDTSGVAVAAIRRAQSSLHKTEGPLRTGLASLPDAWNSPKVFHRLLCLLDLSDCTLIDSVLMAFRKMKLSNVNLSDLIALARTHHGFPIAIELIVATATPEARATLVKIAAELPKEDPRIGCLNDAAVEISVNMNDARVIPVLINRLVAAYAEFGEKIDIADPWDRGEDHAHHRSAIIEKLTGVIQNTREKLAPPLLQQLAGLGSVPKPKAGSTDRNPHLGVRQDIIARDLSPVRVAAANELKRRSRAG